MKKYLKLIVLALMSIVVSSCGSDENDELISNLNQMILGDWQADPDGWQITFKGSTCVTTMWNGVTKTYNYSLEDNRLKIENYANISGSVSFLDDNIMIIQREGLSDFRFKRRPNDGWNNGASGGDGEVSGESPHENYIHYRYYQTKDYYHEIKCVKQEIELASVGTVHGWNFKYLNVYICDSRLKVGFQFESTYYEDEYPPTSPWPAMTYDITSVSGSAISHFPIARVFVYDENMSRKTFYSTIGTGEIKYHGNKMIFNFTSKEKDPDYYVDLHFEGVLSY